VTAVYVGGMTYEEAARATGIPLGTLKRYLRDGLAQLREELGDRLEER
jgi:DNA-directed RNA polymerase specialized sigma24 family protein